MDEKEWLTSTEPEAMLYQLLGSEPYGDQTEWGRMPIATDRKLRLFACACCREWKHGDMYCESTGLLECIATAEKDADGVPLDKGERPLRMWSYLLAEPNAIDAARGCIRAVEDDAKAANLLREIFGNPYRPVLTEKQWATDVYKHAHLMSAAKYHNWTSKEMEQQVLRQCHLTPTVLAIAQAMYDTRDFSGMGQLSDALEEAGCTNEEILNHCRGLERCYDQWGHHYFESRPEDCKTCKGIGWIPLRGPHCRGCWCLDLILGKS